MSLDIRQLSRLKKHCSDGYTLIEVLIAIAIFSSMMLLASMALYQGLKQYHGLMEKGLSFWDYARYLWIDRSLNSTTDYYINTREDGWTPYFIGNQDVISYISLSPMSGELPVVAWIKNEKQDNGKRSIIYYELPVYTKTYQDIDRAYTLADYKKGNSIRIFEDIDNVEISFYGFDISDKKYEWHNNYDARKTKVLPSVLKISFSHNGENGMFVFGINVNSRIKMNYNEFYPGL